MYTINYDKHHNVIEVKNASIGIYGKIYLNDGGSLQELILNKQRLIADLHPLRYETTYASAILFPFANRIEDGQYCFNYEVFQLETNNREENNALHGLVYNKPFEIKRQVANDHYAEIKLQFKASKTEKGFPFLYTIQLTYVFNQNSLDLEVTVINNGDETFPFTLGWHPYFLSNTLSKSQLVFKSTKKLMLGHRNIALGFNNISSNQTLRFGKKNLDDSWMLENPNVLFMTSEYKLNIISSEPNSFIHVYTPPKPNVVAIEPTTGVSNSFNNKIGLKTLAPNEVYQLKWNVKIHKTKKCYE